MMTVTRENDMTNKRTSDDDEFYIGDVKKYPVKVLISHTKGADTILIFNTRWQLESFLMKRAYLKERLESNQKLSVIKIWE